jgi:hypothetical protein
MIAGEKRFCLSDEDPVVMKDRHFVGHLIEETDQTYNIQLHDSSISI